MLQLYNYFQMFLEYWISRWVWVPFQISKCWIFLLNCFEWPVKLATMYWITLNYTTKKSKLQTPLNSTTQDLKIWLLFIEHLFLKTKPCIHLWCKNLASRTQSNWLLMHGCLKPVLHKDDFFRIEKKTTAINIYYCIRYGWW